MFNLSIIEGLFLQEYNAKKSCFGLINGEIVWLNVLAFLYLHYASAQAFYIIATGQAKLSTCIICKFKNTQYLLKYWINVSQFVVGYLFAGFAALGVTAGAHRLWTHNGYKAKWPLKLIWMYLNCMAFQNSVYEWARDHR